MSDMNEPGEVPPDLPPEYAEAYRRGYQRAYEQASDPEQTATHRAPVPSSPGPNSPVPSSLPPGAAPEPTTRMSFEDWFTESDESDDSSAYDAVPVDRERPRWLVPALLAVLALALILAAYAVGRAFSSSVASANAQTGPSKLVIPSSSQLPSGGQSGGPTSSQKPGGAYTGATDLASVTAAGASCQSADAFDAGGNKVSYAPNNVFDQDMSTAWRCGGDGHGDQLTITLAKKMPIGEVGLVPGYAKTDPYDGSDRYAENDRITKVRWTFDNGHSVVQKLDGSAHNRRMQTMRIPVTDTGSLTMTILDTTPGPRHTVAVSEVRIGRVAD